MIKLNEGLLQDLGLDFLPGPQKNAMLQAMYDELEMRVGRRLARQMTQQQLDEFEELIDADDQAGALRWLETNFPRYKDDVAEEFEILCSEVQASTAEIRSASIAYPP